VSQSSRLLLVTGTVASFDRPRWSVFAWRLNKRAFQTTSSVSVLQATVPLTRRSSAKFAKTTACLPRRLRKRTNGSQRSKTDPLPENHCTVITCFVFPPARRTVPFTCLTTSSPNTGWSFSLPKIRWLWATTSSARHRSTKHVRHPAKRARRRFGFFLCFFLKYFEIVPEKISHYLKDVLNDRSSS